MHQIGKKNTFSQFFCVKYYCHMSRKHLTAQILMIRPSNFGFNEETAESNAFQNGKTNLSPKEIKAIAKKEFDDFVKKLRKVGVGVTVVEDQPKVVTPDSIFPNNWISFHQDGTIVTYPMLSNLRRLERRDDIVKLLADNFQIKEQVHFEHLENQDLILEGTGSMVLDRYNKIAYACISPRTNEQALDLFCSKIGYEKVAFESVDQNGQQVYHTNVMMAMGEKYVIIALGSIHKKKEREAVIQTFKKTKKEIIEISFDEMNSFAGNMLLLDTKNGKPVLVMSTQAYESLSEEKIKKLKSYQPILHSSLNNIEQFGGGSARCMMAEVFLPEK